MSNYCPKSKKLNPWPPKPLNIDIGQSFPVDPLKVLKKSFRSNITFVNIKWSRWSRNRDGFEAVRK